MAMTPSSSSRPAVGDRGEVVAGPAVGDKGEVVAGPAAEDKGTPGSDPAAAWGETALSAEPLDMVGMLARAHHPGAGAVVLFSGEVRDNNRGKAVSFLEYEAHGTLAEKAIAGILSAAREKYSLLVALARHRIGHVAVGESAIVVITASAHRAAAYSANQYIVDRIKQEAPIWKREFYMDGASEWGNAEGSRERGGADEYREGGSTGEARERTSNP
jgi:molybdopterin synthase catalytic subunit